MPPKPKQIRHNSVLAYLHDTFNTAKPDGFKIYSDLEGCKINGGTDLARPDMVSVNLKSSPQEVIIVELTIPWDFSCENAENRKRERYEFLVQDIKDKGYKCSNHPLEIGARGFISNRNRGVLTHLCHILKIRKL